MPKPKSPFPRERLHVYLKQEIIARLRILFATENNLSGVSHGALSKFVESAVEEKLARLTKEERECESQSV
jgi:hypothetical protein